MKIKATFRKHFTDGLGDDYPTDFLHAPPDVIESFDFIEMRPPADGGEYGEEEWLYDIADDRVDSFEAACQRCETVISFSDYAEPPVIRAAVIE